MSFQGIATYSARAVGFAVIVSGLYWLIRHLQGKKTKFADVLAIAYLAAVTEIIALRFGSAPASRMIRWIPMTTTLEEAKGGAWSLIYHVCGNLVWFLPMGILVQWKKPKWRLLQIAAFGAAFSAVLETLQFLLSTGMTDIDDVILNALGTAFGALIQRAVRRFKKDV